MPKKVRSHRLLVSAERWARLRTLPKLPLLRQAAARLAESAEPWVDERALPTDETDHNWHLIRARHAQTRIVSMLVRYGMTGDRRYRNAALDYVRDVAGWEHWSWFEWLDRNAAPNATFDLSYGENATTLALAYDWLAEELTPEERALLVETARTRALIPYLECNGTPGQERGGGFRASGNWNTVCNGGAGMLALALSGVAPESARVLELVEDSVRYYFEAMEEDGAVAEGIGYWSYGHRYGYMYLLSHERATGRRHPLLERPGSRNTFRFPFLFSPNGVATGFSDSNYFFPERFIYAAAERYEMTEIVAEMDRRITAPLDPGIPTGDSWPFDAETLLFHPGATPAVTDWPWPRASVQKGVEWGYLCDAWPRPALYVSVRGGTTEMAPWHNHQDLTSLWVVVGDEPLVVNVTEDDYIDTTFSPRRFDLYEMSPAAKNVMFVNGVGLPRGEVKTQALAPGWEGILLDATALASVGAPVDLYARAVLMLEGKAILVLDRVIMQHTGLGEVRYHTRGRLRLGKASAHIQGTAHALHLSFAANVLGHLARSQGLPTSPTRQPDTVLRWLADGKHREIVLATLLSPEGAGRVALDAAARTVRVSGPGYAATVSYGEKTLDLA
jgi:hypothetical protein